MGAAPCEEIIHVQRPLLNFLTLKQPDPRAQSRPMGCQTAIVSGSCVKSTLRTRPQFDHLKTLHATKFEILPYTGHHLSQLARQALVTANRAIQEDVVQCLATLDGVSLEHGAIFSTFRFRWAGDGHSDIGDTSQRTND